MSRTFTPKDVLRDFKPKTTQTQNRIIKKYFDTFIESRINHSVCKKQHPDTTEGWFVGGDFSLLSESYQEALEMVFDAISENRKFENRIADKMRGKHFRQTGLTEGMIEVIKENQDDNHVFIYPAQLGEFYYGLTPGSVRRRLIHAKFGLTTFLVSLILLTHDELLCSQKELAICCVGDEFSPNGDYNFDSAPVFHLDKDGTLVLDYINRGYNWNKSVGCATGIIPCG